MDSQSQDHPLLLELNSLRSAVARFQDEAHASAVKLQRHSLDRANAHERAVILERENDSLKAEIAVLRANPVTSSNSTGEQVQQLTLSLRRLSEKLTLTEDALSGKTTELTQANANLAKALIAVENAYELGARVRGREEAAKIRENQLEWRLRGAEEEKKMAEIAVGEYANLVRSMEARMGLGSTSTLVSTDGIKEDSTEHHSGDAQGVTLADSLVEGKLGLKRLLSEFQSDTEELQRQLGQLRGELEVLKSNHEAERKGAQILHVELAKAQTELHKLKIDDNTAARMVSRYMQFSQASTNALQSTLSTIKTRHAATLSTLTSTSYSLASNLRSAETTIERLRTSLDELGREMMKETYGRRREVASRVRLLGREEKILEGLRRWLRKGEEAISDCDSDNEIQDSQSRVRAALLGMTQDARILLESLDDGLVTDSTSLSGSLARVVLAQGLVDGLVEELRMETARRMDLEKTVLQETQDTSPPTITLNGYDINQRPLVRDEQESFPNVSSSTFTPPLETTTVQLSESESEEAKPGTTIPVDIDTISSDTNAPDIPSLTDQDGHIPPELTLLADDTFSEHSLSQVHTHRSNNLTPNQPSTTVFPESIATAKSPPVNAQLAIPSSTPTPEIVIDADVAQPHTVYAENTLHEEPSIDNQPDLVIIQTDIALDKIDSSVETVAAGVGPGPAVELVIDNSSSPSTVIDSPVEAIAAGVGPGPTAELVIDNSSSPLAVIDPSVETVAAGVGPGSAVELVIDNSSSPLGVINPSVETVAAEVGPGSTVELVIDDSSSPSTVIDSVVPSDPPLPAFPTSQPPVQAEKEELQIPIPHPLLAELAKIGHRYDDFQRSFRDCHLALEGLKTSLGFSSSTTSSNSQSSIYTNRQTGGKPPELILTPIVPIDILHAAVSRLDDYTEDVRVEVEIRISDEEVLAKGYEVLLCVPGALYSSFAPAPSLLSQSYPDDGEDQTFAPNDSSSIPPTQSELEIQVEAFIAGTDPSVTKAREGFSKKLEDVQHDIAILKKATHDPDPEMMIDDRPELSSQLSETGSRGWTSWIRSSSGPSTPLSASTTTASPKHVGGLGPSPMFGSIMTSPHRLKHSPSLNLNAYGHQNNGSSVNFVSGSGSSWRQGEGRVRRGDILGRLGLRVPMPIFDSAVHQPSPPPSSSNTTMGGWTMPTPIKQRSVSSTTYMLGLGASPMMTTARSRGANSLSAGPQKGDGSTPVAGVPVNGIQSVGLGDVERSDKFRSVEHEEQDVDVE